MNFRSEMLDNFNKVFNTTEKALIVRSPGKVNIIGEHTHDNFSLVLPAAINKAMYVAVTKRADNKICLHAQQFNESYETTLTGIVKSSRHWPNHILAVVQQLEKIGLLKQGFNLLADGDLPIGVGLSSSAAMSCATIFALNELFTLQISKAEMVHITQKAASEFMGIKCSVMDVFTSLFGKRDHLIHLDCSSLFYEYVPINLKNYKLLLLNTNIIQSRPSLTYDLWQNQFEQALNWIKEFKPDVKALKDVTLMMLNEYVLPKNKLIYQRCKYVIDENKRLLQACADLQKNNINALGKKMFETQHELRNILGASCKELDFLVDYVEKHNAVVGARMLGNGFGSCTLNIIKDDAISHFLEEITNAYAKETGNKLTSYIVEIESGTAVI